jgi:predicted nucleic acid-binding protein
MNIVIDTSVVISVITNEMHKGSLIKITQGSNLIAPSSLHWEVGNAFTAMFKRKKLTLNKAIKALNFYQQIPLRFIDISLKEAIEIGHELGIYAYDAYFIVCAKKLNIPLLSLDSSLLRTAEKMEIKTMEIK